MTVGEAAKFSERRRKSPPAPRVQRPQAGHTCSRWASCPCATCETALYDGSGFPACDRKRLRRPVRDVAAPKTSLCPRSNGSAPQACDTRHHRLLVRTQPNLSKDERSAHSRGTE